VLHSHADLINQDSLRTLKLQLDAKGVIPFVGAGLSVPLGYMGWSAFLKNAAREFGVYDHVADMVDRKGEYEEAAELLSGKPGFSERLRDHFGQEPRRSGKSCPVEMLPKLFPSGPIFTTNYDHVLEEVFANHGKPFLHVLHTSVGRSIATILELREHVLIKLHGDYSSREYRVLTLTDYHQHYGLADEGVFDENLFLPSALIQLFSTESVLFLGCALRGDRYLRIMERVRPRTTHFAILGSIEDASRSALEACRIRPILYDPFDGHRLLETIVKYLCGEITPVSPANVNVGIYASTDLLAEVARYWEQHPTGLPQLKGTAFYEAFRFRKDDRSARLELKLEDGSVVLIAEPSLRVLGTESDRFSVNLQNPAEGTVNFEFLPTTAPILVTVEPGQVPCVVLKDPASHFSIRFRIATEPIESAA
jgi:hypothetical protein